MEHSASDSPRGSTKKSAYPPAETQSTASTAMAPLDIYKRRYPVQHAPTEQEALCAEDIAKPSLTLASRLLAKQRRRNTNPDFSGTLVLCESAIEKRVNFQQAQFEALGSDKPVATKPVAPYKINHRKIMQPHELMRFFRTRHAGAGVTAVCCSRCDNNSQYFYDIKQDSNLFTWDGSKWLCRPCRDILNLQNDPHNRALRSLPCAMKDVMRRSQRERVRAALRNGSAKNRHRHCLSLYRAATKAFAFKRLNRRSQPISVYPVLRKTKK